MPYIPNPKPERAEYQRELDFFLDLVLQFDERAVLLLQLRLCLAQCCLILYIYMVCVCVCVCVCVSVSSLLTAAPSCIHSHVTPRRPRGRILNTLALLSTAWLSPLN